MIAKDIIRVLEELAPPYLQESYDNSGLIAGDPRQEVNGALICLDVTEEVLHEAMARGLQMIISHHPFIFKALKRINGDNVNERLLMEAIKKEILIYAAHTNLDSVSGGVSTALAGKLGLTRQRILSPRKALLRKLVTFCPVDKAEEVRDSIFSAGAGFIGNYSHCSYNIQGQGTFKAMEGAEPYVGKINEVHFENETRIETIYPVYYEKGIIEALLRSHPYEEVAYDIYSLENTNYQIGYGIIGELEVSWDEESFLRMVREICNAGILRHSGLLGRKVNKVAVCGGSGNFLIYEAISAGADIFITGELKYHDFFETESRIVLADIGHYESEQFAQQVMLGLLKEKFANFAAFISGVNTNPVHYL